MKHLKKFESTNRDEILDHFVDLIDDGVKFRYIINKMTHMDRVRYGVEMDDVQIQFQRDRAGRVPFGLKKSDIIEIMNSCIRLNSYYEVKDFILEVDDEIGYSEEHFSVKNPQHLIEFLEGVTENYYVVYISIGKF